MELCDFLDWLIVTAGPVAFAAMEYLPKVWPEAFAWLEELHPMLKRALAYLVSALIADGAFLAKVGMQYAVLPADPRLAAAELFKIGTVAFGLSQLLHLFVLKRKPAPEPAT